MVSRNALTPPRQSSAIRMGLGVLVGSLICFLDTIVAATVVPPVPLESKADAVEKEYQALVSLSKISTPLDLTTSHENNNRLHERGVAFLNSFPTHPRRWDVVVLLNRTVWFTREEVDEKGVARVVRDDERHRKWNEEYRRLAAELLKAPDAGSEARQKTLVFFIRQYAVNVAEKRAPNPRASVTLIKSLLDDLGQYPPSGMLLSGYRDYVRSLETVDSLACVEFLRELARRHASGSSLDRNIREFAATHLKLMEAQAVPVWEQLAGIDASLADTNNLRGKVVLIAFVPVGWAQYNTMLAEMNRKFRGQDFEIVQISSDWPVAKELQGPEQPLVPEWRLVHDHENNMGRVVAKLGLNTIPSWLIVARDGKFVTDATSRTLATVLERELALKQE